MKNNRLGLLLNLLLASFSFYILLDSLNKEIWRLICAGTGCMVFATLTILLIRQNRQLKDI